MPNKLIIYTDGGARGNPGPAATGVVIKNDAGQTIAAYGEYLGSQTNNYAEYMALLSALKKAAEVAARDGLATREVEVRCILDSLLVVKQMRREFRVKEPTLQKLWVQVYNQAAQFKKVTYEHTLRAGNKEADREVNKVLDLQLLP